MELRDMQNRLENKIQMDFEVERLDPLFATTADYEEFISRHAKHQVPVGDLASYRGNAYLGIDAGSTTTKAALVGEDGTLLYSFYHGNDGDPLGTTIGAIKDIYSQLPEGVQIVHSQPVTEKRSLKPHFFWMKAKLKPYLTITPLLSSNRM